MRAFKVSLNGKKLCTSGVHDNGILTVIVTAVSGSRSKHVGFHVGGLENSNGEHVLWTRKRLRTGDKIQVMVVESDSIDKPKRGPRPNPVERLKSEKRYVREMAKRFGWKIQVGSSKSM